MRPSLAMPCPLHLHSVFQAGEKARAEAAPLKEQHARSASELACLQQQHSSMQQSLEAAAAREADLIRRCEELEAWRQAAGAEQEAATSALRQVQAAAAKASSGLNCFVGAMPFVNWKWPLCMTLLLC